MEHIGTINLETDRVTLRKFTMEDSTDMFNNYCNDEEVTKYLNWQTHKNEEVTKEYLKTFVDGYDKTIYNWAIVDKKTNQVIGALEASKKDEYNKNIMLGWVLSKKFWGQGIMPSVANKIVELLFNVGYERIWAVHQTENFKSGRVMEKIGMKKEGTLKRSALNNYGQMVDSTLWAIVKND